MALKFMKLLLRILFLLLLVISFSCEEKGIGLNCSDCLETEPVEAELEIKLDRNNYAQTVVRIYEGNLEDSVLIGTFNQSSAKLYQEVSINKTYTVTATYLISDVTYVAVDSATPRVKYVKDQCDDPCYFVYDKILNLRLRYTK